MKIRWQFGILAGIFLAIFTLYPQIKLVYTQGEKWQGNYAYNDIDEAVYAAYIRALIDGRPRKNDPFSGQDQSAENPQPESLFSIQFAAPYAIAIPARILGIETPWAMTLAGAFAGFFAALAVFWLISLLTGNSWYAMAASLSVFAFGALAAGEGAIQEVLFDGFSYPYFPGFRRYIPAMTFPAFFAMCGFVWLLLNPKPDENNNKQWIYAAAATGCFAFTVYSYFFVWTTAFAFLACVILVWLMERPETFRRDIKLLFGLTVAWFAVLLPYAYLLSNRSQTMDDVQLLVRTRLPDFFRFPEYISFAVLMMLIAGLATKIIDIKQRETLFALALALVPIVIFNQQVVTGRSLQPIHYQVFIGNYVAMLAVVWTIGILLRKVSYYGNFNKIACTALMTVAIVWGFVECHYTVRVLDQQNVERDQAYKVGKRLEELGEGSGDAKHQTVFAYDMVLADEIPSMAPQNVLWARHQHIFAGMTWQQNKERYYQYLYYSNIDEKGLENLLKRDAVSMIALFGWGRHSNRLTSEAKPLTYGEIAQEARLYGEYRANFSAKDATNPLLSYLVVDNTRKVTDLSMVEEWYDLDEGEVVGDHTIYRTSLK